MSLNDTISALGNAIINFVNRKIVTSISASSTNTTVPSAKCVYDAIQAGGGGGSSTLTYDSTTETLTIN